MGLTPYEECSKYSILGCNSNSKNANIGIMNIASGDDEFSTNCREQLISVVTRDWVIHAGLRDPKAHFSHM